ncbi:hypothetical protein ABEF95_016175 [Exophiala dermatitidis]
MPVRAPSFSSLSSLRAVVISRTTLRSLSRPTILSASSSISIAPRRFLNISPSLPRQSSSPMAAQTDTSAAIAAASSGITPETLAQKLRDTLGATHVQIEDMSGGCGQAFNAIIVCPAFEGKNLLARHRLVNNALKQEIAAIHAWTPKCLTPEQWDKEKDKMDLS